MKENEKHGSNEQPAPEKPAKELTEQQIQQRRKMIVFPLMLLVFAAIMWLIFAPSGGEEATEQAGLNTSLPTPEQSGIVADKRDAYVQQEMKAKQEAKMRSLEDFAFSLGEEPESEEERAAREERGAAHGPQTRRILRGTLALRERNPALIGGCVPRPEPSDRQLL